MDKIIIIVLFLTIGTLNTTKSITNNTNIALQSNASDISQLQDLEISTFNGKFDKYKGSQTGSQISSLIRTAKSNAIINEDTPKKIPTIRFLKKASDIEGDTISEPVDIASINTNTYISKLTDMINNIEYSHTYYVTINYSEEGWVEYINIGYEK